MGRARQEVGIPFGIDMPELIDLRSQKLLHPIGMNIEDIDVIAGRVTVRDVSQLALTVDGNPGHRQPRLGDCRIGGLVIGLSKNGNRVWITCPNQVFGRRIEDQYAVFGERRRKEPVIPIIQADGTAAAELAHRSAGRIGIEIRLPNDCKRFHRPHAVETLVGDVEDHDPLLGV